ncbi:MAG: GH92 family glycosyl hydrolase [Oscillospiraceae bacterium]|jgi:predicted alpha-1,2-mannosidase|nr:GH92 family glycosyl hydrolase [Oscillospiraceae bacterium]
MLQIVNRGFSFFLSLIFSVVGLFTTGKLPSPTPMPATNAGECSQWVDPFIGTGGIPWMSGNLFPGATAPFGAVRLSPDSAFPFGFDPFKLGLAGYWYPQTRLFGFSHTRLSGTGVRDMGHFRVTPAAGSADPAKRLTNPLLFAHAEEVAAPGYYAVRLPSIPCLAELTATAHVGAQRYTFETEKDAHLWVDATSFLLGGRAEEGLIQILPESNALVGEARVFTEFTSRYDGLKAYFYARFNRPLQAYATWQEGESTQGRATAAGVDAGADLNFGNIKGKALEFQLGISFVSVENARLNLEAEAGALDFDGIRAATGAEWEARLSAITIESDDPDVKTIFYTSLYHSMMMPTDFTDVNGEYLGFDGETGIAEDFTYRTDMSLWDTCRTAHPLYALIAPDVQLDSLKSLVRMAQAGGVLPRWPTGNGYSGSMFGDPADIVIAESYLKGITGFDVETAYTYMKRNSDAAPPEGLPGRSAVEAYNTLGYVPADVSKTSVSYTLEYAWEDASIALLADALGKPEEAAVYRAKSMNYKNLFDPETLYFRPRNTDGSWQKLYPHMSSFYDDILGTKYSAAYCEGSAQNWRWSAQQDPQGMIALYGGKEAFVRELNTFMESASPFLAGIDPGAGYWQGNEHDIHAPYLFIEAGRPDLTQKWVRWALTEKHSTGVNGLDGNDDGGTLSAWYVWSAIGLYPMAGTDRYWVGAPIVNKATVALGNGKTLTVTAENQSAKNLYVQRVTLNGVEITDSKLTHAQITAGGTLAFVMGAKAPVRA